MLEKIVFFVVAFCSYCSSLQIQNQRIGKQSKLFMSDERNLLEEMRKTLGEKEDVFADSQKESRQIMQGLRDLDRDPNMRLNNKFIEWLDANGVWVKSESTWGRAQHPLVISSSTEDDGESCGRGILAKESLGEGELLMTIPLDLCLTRSVAQEILGRAVVPDYMDEYIAIALLLMYEKNKGVNSDWKPYLDILPTMQDVYPSFVWSDEELEMLKGSPCYSASLSLRNKVDKEFSDVQKSVFDRNPSMFPPEKYTKELFQWAFVMLFSRAARLASKSSGEELALVPYADLMNHNPYSLTYIDTQKTGLPLISRKEEIALYADRAYKKFEQLFINYGEKGNADLLLLYGFSLERNPFNAVDLAVGLSISDPLYKQKRAYLENSGRGEVSVRFPLQDARYPSELVDFLRLLLVEPDDLGMQQLDKVDFNEPISPSLERRVLEAITDICQEYIQRYPTTVDEDDKLMRDRGLFGALTRQQRMAIKLRASEKRILERTIQAVQAELEKLPALISMSGEKIIPAGRSFDILAKRATVENAKSPADWVVNRDSKKAAAAPTTPSSTAGGAVGTGAKPPPASSIAERRRRRREG